MNKLKERNISLDILRIMAMFGIIGLHLMGQGGILQTLEMNNARGYLMLTIYFIFYLSVDTFGIISGFLSWKKEKVKYKRIVELIFITFFYAFVITLIFYIFNLYNIRNLGNRIIIHSLFPSLIGRNWYITCYILLFFLMPYLNFFINKISRESYKKMLIVLFILLSILPNVFWLTDFFIVNNGYSPFWLIYCYLLGAYAGKYLSDLKIKKKHIITLICCIVGGVLGNALVRIITPMIYDHVMYDSWFLNYVSPFNVAASVIMVLLFNNIKINLKNKFLEKFILYLSICSFSVYIIHSHYLVFDYVLPNMMYDYTQNRIYVLLGALLIGLIAIYLLCFIIDLIRIQLFKLFRINKLIDYLGNKLNKKLD